MDLSKDDLCIFGLLHFMNEKRTHDGVREFLVHKLYEMSDTDIDFVLPQLWYETTTNEGKEVRLDR